ncbi:serine/threonine-protein kinase [Ruicaihuangia caeni]|uniref:Protein kinase n=1 Tax=Ruicaihuangia caeni TaxID=3042517 RepID=A0AAW6T9Y3_9MICO|nr:serine/threonine-protein kinase [Klugiella sp. YN-L-19]MDI2098828.1 protein kinase [Klugiella sp. YN-L-19]
MQALETTSTESPSAESLLGGRYRLGECVGQGGMASVYRAEDVMLGRTVAIKLVREGVDSSADSSATPGRARGEMTVLASLNHSSLVTLFDACLEPGAPEYLVMEFVDGPTLRAHLAGGAMASDDVAQLAIELAEALHVVHTAGIVHRDVKPSNVLMAPPHLPGSHYRAKLADFGIARLIDSVQQTSPGVVIGTAAYLAPEQLRGDDATPAVDIYSLGLVLIEALTGEPAHAPGEGLEVALARLVNPPAVPESVGPEWGDLLRRMTSTDPSLRPTALDVALSAAKLKGAPGAAEEPRSRVPAALPLAAVPTAAVAMTTADPGPATVSTDPPTRPFVADGNVVPLVASRGSANRRQRVIAGAVAAASASLLAITGMLTAGAVSDGSQKLDQTAITEPSEPAPEAGTDAGGAEPAPVVTPIGTESTNSDAEGQAADKAEQNAAEKRQREAEKQAEEARKQAEQEGPAKEAKQNRSENADKVPGQNRGNGQGGGPGSNG